MPDERQDSIRQGIGTPEESAIGKAAEEAKRRQAQDAPAIGGGMGGTSDAESAGDAARARETERRAESGESGRVFPGENPAD